MKKEIVIAASKAIRNRRIYVWTCEHIKAGTYNNPTDMFNDLPNSLPEKLSILFDTPIGFGVLYSRDGAIALMDQIIKPFGALDER